ncbi:sigma-70 family RNA polymerase sigma factor [Candidatus Woesearchaeota archaeon]|nr:sigma-70 family RNA polymerase sigma factor [Candidatus Woesearchaeota archaeon]
MNFTTMKDTTLEEKTRSFYEQTGFDNFSQLYREFYPPIFHYTRRRLPDIGLAEDAAQDTFVKAYRFISTFHPEKDTRQSLRSWLYTIAKNMVSNYHRKRENNLDEFDPVKHGVAYATDPEQKMDAKRVLNLVNVIVPEEFQGVVYLSALKDLTHKEIAEELHIPLGTSMSRLYRAREILVRHSAQFL